MSKYLEIGFKRWLIRFKVVTESKPQPKPMTTEQMIYHALMGDDVPRGTDWEKP